MSNIEKIKVTLNDCYDVTFAVDHDKVTTKLLNTINNFWSGADDRFHDAGDDILLAVLTYAAQIAMSEQVGQGLNSLGVMDSFSDREGWASLDGSWGILLVHCDEFEFTFDVDSDVTRTPLDAMPNPPNGNT